MFWSSMCVQLLQKSTATTSLLNSASAGDASSLFLAHNSRASLIYHTSDIPAVLTRARSWWEFLQELVVLAWTVVLAGTGGSGSTQHTFVFWVVVAKLV